LALFVSNMLLDFRHNMVHLIQVYRKAIDGSPNKFVEFLGELCRGYSHQQEMVSDCEYFGSPGHIFRASVHRSRTLCEDGLCPDCQGVGTGAFRNWGFHFRSIEREEHTRKTFSLKKAARVYDGVRSASTSLGITSRAASMSR
jgi:hypothetical protein